MKGLIRFAVIWGISRALAPRLDRVFQRLLTRAPRGSFLEDVLRELSTQHSTSIIRSFGETAGEMVFGPSSKGRARK